MTTARDVLVYIPNLIGYARVVLTLTSLVLMTAVPSQWLLAVVLYFLSFAGDMIDGMAARRYNQCSQFGGVLDMITDRCSTLGLLMVLSSASKSDVYSLIYMGLAILDVSSHWIQMHSTLGQHHKSEEGNQGRHFLVRWFYKYYWFFGYLCVGAELTYITSFALIRMSDKNEWYKVVETLRYLCLPGCVLKQCVNTSQLLSACYAIAEMDARNISNKSNSSSGSVGGAGKKAGKAS
jgi:CDP-diacylglycerol--inositol 3-phosphatidyltransferase